MNATLKEVHVQIQLKSLGTNAFSSNSKGEFVFIRCM